MGVSVFLGDIAKYQLWERKIIDLPGEGEYNESQLTTSQKNLSATRGGVARRDHERKF